MTTSTVPAELTLITVDPASLGVLDQARGDATPDDQLIQSIQQFGIMQPPTVTWNEEQGKHVIVMGHRRVGAAIAAGLTEIVVILRRDDLEHGALKLEQQIVENERRKGLSPGELAQGYANLESMFGQTPEDIAAALAESPDRIRAGIRAARSQKTAELLEKVPTIDLAQAAVIAEFDTNPAAQKKLIDTATDAPQNFSWRVEQIRREVELDDAREAAIAPVRDAGVRIAKLDAYGHPGNKVRSLGSLRAANGKNLTEKSHAKCPGHVAYPAGWSKESIEDRYACDDWEAQGHVISHGGNESAAEAAERAAREAARIARDEAIAANRTARRDWLADLLPGKINQLPGVYDYMAAALLRDHQYYGDHRAPATTLALLRREVSGKTDVAALYASVAAETAPFRMMLATSLAIHEEEAERGRAIAGLRHFAQLERWGYRLTDLETEIREAWTERLADPITPAEEDIVEEADD